MRRDGSLDVLLGGRELVQFGQLPVTLGLEAPEGLGGHQVAVALLAVGESSGLEQPGEVRALYPEEVGGFRGGEHRVLPAGERVDHLV